jgi:hypothetical protein
MSGSASDLLKTYAVVAVDAQGVAFKLVETFWFKRAVREFNAAKDSGRWELVQVLLGDRVYLAYRVNEGISARPAGRDGESRSASRGPSSSSRRSV